ncbi:ABC transporter ATP-binding protein [Ignicoccus islandicus DSM 13165]|uniref:ABC transporter ATP-binding protein n=1 Tax=Ignicoccus islandicus DSM 13165 TaxID=940295 RepID=A0A0U3G063_9CREN|nr:ABC transporter ATP-binding protein [Ignicoccus islandicus]ALU11708.1 ABC transporter ATP-binding protein [Ignicoccus islandicus DSM 13165]
MASCIRTVNITKSYVINGKKVKVLKETNLEVECGQLVSIVGPSGAGKSTLLNILSTIDSPSKGRVEHLGVTVYPRGEDWRAKWRRDHVGVVLQFIFLVPTLTAYENVLLALELSKKFKDRVRRALKILETVGLIDKADRYPSELSGGEQQRVALARAIANDPEIIIADEPLSNLDRQNRIMLSKLLRKLADEGKAVVVTTHEDELVRVSDIVCEMKRGELNCP